MTILSHQEVIAEGGLCSRINSTDPEVKREALVEAKELLESGGLTPKARKMILPMLHEVNVTVTEDIDDKAPSKPAELVETSAPAESTETVEAPVVPAEKPKKAKAEPKSKLKPSADLEDKLDEALKPEPVAAEPKAKPDSLAKQIKSQTPFKAVYVEQKVTTFGTLVARLEHGEIDLAPAFQRSAGIWSQTMKSLFIESLILGIPIPSFYFSEDAEGRWTVVDGLQRTTCVAEYMADQWKLTGLEYLDSLTGHTYSDLPKTAQRSISDTNIHINLVGMRSDPKLKVEVFARINRGGVRLNAQEIRNAVFGSSVEKLRSITRLADFEALGSSNKRQQEMEMALRVCSMQTLEFPDQYESMGGLLSDTMVDLTDEVVQKAKTALARAAIIFGNSLGRREGAKRVIKPAVDGWMYWLPRLSSAQWDMLLESKEKQAQLVQMAYALIESGGSYERACSVSTGGKESFTLRINAVRGLLETVIGGMIG